MNGHVSTPEQAVMIMARQGVTFPELTERDKDFLRALGGGR